MLRSLIKCIQGEETFPMGCCDLALLSCLIWSFLILGTHQLQSSQTQVLLQIRKRLEYPNQLEIWNNHGMDFCYLSPSTQLNMTCQDNSVTELRILGNKPAKASNFVGFAIPNQTLSENFSMDSFVATLARLTSLRVLSLVSLGIWGPFPDKIHRLFSLEYLDLSSNYLFGSIPPKISTMVKLQTLILNDNFFNDTVPDWFDSLSNLTIVSIRNNSLSGEIPKQYGQLSQLQHLDMSFNKLRGKLPATLLALPNISYLNLASNMLSGSVPDHLSCGGKLQFVDISNNRFTGGLPNCLSAESENRVVKFGGNCLSIDRDHQHAESSCIDAPIAVERKHAGGKNVGVLVGVIVGVIVIVVLLALGFLVVCKLYCPRGVSEQHLLHKAGQDKSATGFSSEILTNARFISEAAKLGTQGLPACRSFTLEELKEATNNFNNSAILGEGSYGKLYKGILDNGIQVAIRCIPSSKKFSIRNLKLRLDLLGKLRHTHLVCLLGHCIDGGGQDDYRVTKVFLVYEYVSNGNFRAQLSEDSTRKVLNWSERLAVLIGVAKGIHFLHTGVIPGFFNNLLKTNNILLNEYGMAKLSDYGLSIISEGTGNSGENRDGPKSWQMARLEDDVCSFGFILLESLVGPSVFARRDKLLFDELASCSSEEGRRKLINPIVLATCSQESLSIVITITNKCICSESWSRPSFEDILWNLQYASQVQATADSEQRFDTVSLR